jgi:acyl carrier protein|tara:strand:+ start:170 stop:430 length:261 start_codon:yes stop_codon:yes gene_type:complete
MNKKNIIEKINLFLIEDFEIEPDVILPESKIIDDLDIDSLDFVDIVVFTDSIFDIKLEDKDFIDILTLQDFYDLIENKFKQKGLDL